jgi:hypothetical protein
MDILDRKCEKFMGGPKVPSRELAHVTIGPRGTMFLNQKAQTLMGRPLAVYLYFNREKDMIILEPTAALTAREAFSLRGVKGMSGRYISANPFCKHLNIRPDATLRFTNPNVDAVGRMYLKLNETVRVPRPRRRKK